MTFSKIENLKMAIFRHIIGAVLIFILVVTAFALITWYYPPTYRAWSVMAWQPGSKDLWPKGESRYSYLANKAARIITDKKLTEITKSRGLGLSGKSQSQLLADMRKNTAIAILPDSVDKGILFTVSYSSQSPEVAVLVTKDLTNLFVTAPAKPSSEITPLKTLVNDLETSQAALEKIIELFKIQNAGYLPEHAILNKQMIENLNQRKNDLEQRLIALKNTWVENTAGFRAGQQAEDLFLPEAVLAARFSTRTLGLLGLLAMAPTENRASGNNASENSVGQAQESQRLWLETGWLIAADLAAKDQLEQKISEYSAMLDRGKIVYQIYLQFTANLKMTARNLDWARKELEQAESPVVTGRQESIVILESAESHLEMAGPEILWWTLISIGLGLGMAVFYIFIREITDRRVNYPKTARSLTGWPVIGILPSIKNKR